MRGSTRTSTRAANDRMRGSESAGSTNAGTSARPSTRAAATAYGIENFAASMDVGAGSAMRGANGIVVTITRSTWAASRRSAPRHREQRVECCVVVAATGVELEVVLLDAQRA